MVGGAAHLLSGGRRARFLTVVVSHGPVPFMEEFLIVTAGTMRTSCKIFEATPMVASSHFGGSDRRARLKSRASGPGEDVATEFGLPGW